MGRLPAQDKRQRTFADQDFTFRRQTIRFGPVQIDHEVNLGPRAGFSPYQSQTARLDQPMQTGGRGREYLGPDAGQVHLIIGHKLAAKPHQMQCEAGLSGPCAPKDQQTAPLKCHTTGMQQRHRNQTGRPTTKRAPSGSEVTSAWVGRMFSAQITPPWASTICFEIARPRPE